jgi:hypothetical protein
MTTFFDCLEHSVRERRRAKPASAAGFASYRSTVTDEPLSNDELDELDKLATSASPAPWIAFGGPAIGGPDFIRIGGDDSSQPDMYVEHDGRPAPVADLDFIAAARNYVPRLIREIRSRRATDKPPA